MSRRPRFLPALRRQIETWGGQLIEGDVPKGPGISEAPFASGLAVHWERKVIYWDPHFTDDAPGIIHEAGHVFTTRSAPLHSVESDFLGWEWALSRAIGCERAWIRSNAAYGVLGLPYTHPMAEFGELSPRSRRKLLLERLAHAEHLGIVVEGKPQAIR